MEKIIEILTQFKDETGYFEFLSSMPETLKKAMLFSLGFGLLLSIFSLVVIGLLIGFVSYVKFTYKINIPISSIFEKRDQGSKKESE